MIQRIVLTGASSGIGAALTAAYAAPGVSLLLIGRNEERLAEVSASARAAGAEVEIAAIDVTDEAGIEARILAYDDSAPVDLVIANAGIALGGFPEPEGLSRRLIDVNLIGMLNTVEPLLPRFIARGAGQFALVSSVSAIRPSADLASYSATKAAIRAYGQAIRSGLRGHGVSVTVICPGFVTSPMSNRHHGPKPFEVTAENAARIMKAAIAKRRGHLTFPWQFSWMIFMCNRLPPFLSDWFERRYAARIGD